MNRLNVPKPIGVIGALPPKADGEAAAGDDVKAPKSAKPPVAVAAGGGPAKADAPKASKELEACACCGAGGAEVNAPKSAWKDAAGAGAGAAKENRSAEAEDNAEGAPLKPPLAAANPEVMEKRTFDLIGSSA